ncbi:MAG TPA: tRNA (adenosine(37)-N6)-dimethylallyltransferase MiaA [Candidatus Angelobacter sp.]|nr:tRNA (adenosine(37)-N6)-dimethylallyltransferase MiaA [Candidatus Angelobacter sp.]
MSEPLLPVILGPTGSGKTALSLYLAERMNGEIVSCDSVALYRHLEIGTAKPTREERSRVPHHLIDVVEPTELVTAGDYSRRARRAIQEIGSRGRLPIVVGGTGLYLRALLEGLFPGPPRSEELRARLRERAAERGPEYLHRLLRRRDPRAAQAIHANDVPKVIRALEVSLSSRQAMTGLWQQGRDALSGFRILRLGLNPPREKLYELLNARAGKMFERGLVEETRALGERYGASAWPLNSLGYKQAAQYLAGELTLKQAIAGVQQGHRNYAKRQMTWFRREPDVRWLEGFGSDSGMQKLSREWLEEAA